jgi:hypothetical protein
MKERKRFWLWRHLKRFVFGVWVFVSLTPQLRLPPWSGDGNHIVTFTKITNKMTDSTFYEYSWIIWLTYYDISISIISINMHKCIRTSVDSRVLIVLGLLLATGQMPKSNQSATHPHPIHQVQHIRYSSVIHPLFQPFTTVSGLD